MFVLVTGGSASGKSQIGENICCKINKGNMAYIATMYPYDDECSKRIQKHRYERKDKGFITIERYTDIGGIDIILFDTVIIECISNLVANEMFMQKNNQKEYISEYIISGIKKIYENVNNMVIISNEVFSDGVLYDSETMEYIKQIGQLNNKISKISDIVIESVVGIPLFLKGNLTL